MAKKNLQILANDIEYPFCIKYNLFKDGSPLVQGFFTEEEFLKEYNKKKKEGYNVIKIKGDTNTIRYHLGIKLNNQIN